MLFLFRLKSKFFLQYFIFSIILVPEDLSITRIAGLPWDQWSTHLAMPLVTQLREGIHPLLFPTDLTVNPIASILDDKKSIKLLSPVSNLLAIQVLKLTLDQVFTNQVRSFIKRKMLMNILEN